MSGRTDRTPLRSDARRSYEAILATAREIFSETPNVPMYELAKRAGVGQATLYRHFPERADLAAALADELLDEIDASLLSEQAAEDPTTFEALIRAVVGLMAQSQCLVGAIRQDVEAQREAELRERVMAMLERPLATAIAVGRVRPEVETEDVVLALSMLEGVLGAIPDPAERAERAERMLGLLFGGLLTCTD